MAVKIYPEESRVFPVTGAQFGEVQRYVSFGFAHRLGRAAS